MGSYEPTYEHATAIITALSDPPPAARVMTPIELLDRWPAALTAEVRRLRAERDDALAAIERLHSWGGLMALLDEHWPEDIFPTLPDDDSRDQGPRIVSLIRVVDRLRRELAIARINPEDHIDSESWSEDCQGWSTPIPTHDMCDDPACSCPCHTMGDAS